MKRFFHWADRDFDPARVGGKARALAEAARAGFEVPDWFVVPASAGDHPSGPEVDRGFGSALERMLDRIGGSSFAVRSSALDEDGSSDSYAGQLESFLNVPRPEVAARIAEVRASAFSERAAAYRKARGIAADAGTPGVIVQRMVPSQRAGVAFSADPVSGSRRTSVIAVVEGLGDQLVDGSQSGQTFEVSSTSVRARELTEAPLLPDEGVRRIATLARGCERLFGCPQDIEWALVGEQLFLLQSRPITTLHRQADPDEPLRIWDNSNIAESYNGVTTALTFSFARTAYEQVYLQFVRILKVPGERIEREREVFATMLGRVDGRIYYNLISWYRVLAMLPGFALNREFMEQMMGVREPLPEEVLRELRPDLRRGRIREWFEVGQTLLGLLAALLGLGRGRRRFLDRVEHALQRDAALEALGEHELVRAYRRLEAELLPRWDAPLVNDFFAMIAFGILRKLCAAWFPDAPAGLPNELIAGGTEVISAEPARRISEIAALARKDPEFVELLRTAPAWEVQLALRHRPEFREPIDAYLRKFGDRCLEELKLESPTLADDATPLYRSIGALARRKPKSATPPGERRPLAFSSPVRKALFAVVLRQARQRVADRENLRFERTRVFGRVRRIFLELGRRFRARGVLDSERDIFHLTVQEALGAVEGTSVTQDLRGLAALRRREFEEHLARPAPPDRFCTRGDFRLESTKEAGRNRQAEGDTQTGIPCCPGQARGRARVIRDPKNAVIEEGEILVAPRTDPGWILLFPAAAGLIVEHGSLLSHSAIVSRELGLPSVVALHGATEWIRNGDLIELDGTTGRVQRLEPTIRTNETDAGA